MNKKSFAVVGIIFSLYVIIWFSMVDLSRYWYKDNILRCNELSNCGKYREYSVDVVIEFNYFGHRDWCEKFDRYSAENGGETAWDYFQLAFSPLEHTVRFALGLPGTINESIIVRIEQDKITAADPSDTKDYGYEMPSDNSIRIGNEISQYVETKYSKN